jgi:hypothetical protein
MKAVSKLLVVIAVLGLISFTFCTEATAELPGPSTLVNLFGSSTTGEVSSFSIINANGTVQAYQIPSGKALIIQSINFTIYGIGDSYDPIFILIGPAPYYKLCHVLQPNSISGGIRQHSVIYISGGIAISNNSILKVKVTKTDGSSVPGTLEIRILGYHTSLTASNAPNLFLLLGKSEVVDSRMVSMAAFGKNLYPSIR